MNTVGEFAAVLLAVALVGAGIALIINGIRNTLYAYTLTRQVLRDRSTRVLQQRVDRLEARSDFYAKQLIKIRLRTMTEDDLARGDAVLLAELRKSAGPGGSSPPGPRDHQSPPASEEEGQA